MGEVEKIFNDSLIEFIREHSAEDTVKLVLSGERYPDIDIKLAATIIEARRKIAEKVPKWAGRFDLFYPNTLAAEQSSSSHTAVYKQHFFDGGTVIDLTGGMGIDSYYMAQKAQKLCYIERNPELCLAAEYNFRKLGLKNISTYNYYISKKNISSVIDCVVKEAESREYPARQKNVSLIYLDPARRGDNNRRIYAISDCEPNIIELKEELFRHTDTVLIKVSPMADIKSLIREFPETASIHVLSVENECKELLILLSSEKRYSEEEVEIVCVNFAKNGLFKPFVFTYYDELSAISTFAPHIKEYLYEPNSSLLKAGAFKSVSKAYGVEKLEKNTHLYTSDKIIEGFPGRVFKVKEVMEYNNKTLLNLKKTYPKANVAVRNFPISADQLKRRGEIEDGGETYIIGTTISIGRKATKKIVVCNRI